MVKAGSKKFLINEMGNFRKKENLFIQWMNEHPLNEEIYSAHFQYGLNKEFWEISNAYKYFISITDQTLGFFDGNQENQEAVDLADEFYGKVCDVVVLADKIMASKRYRYNQLLKLYEELVVPVERVWQFLGVVAREDPEIAEELRLEAARQDDPYIADCYDGLLFRKD